jgi:hypothetical protein
VWFFGRVSPLRLFEPLLEVGKPLSEIFFVHEVAQYI